MYLAVWSQAASFFLLYHYAPGGNISPMYHYAPGGIISPLYHYAPGGKNIILIYPFEKMARFIFNFKIS
jgi:hypothetical protein